ncbi:NUDIX hydrolase [uncultured Roseobacter sp.]|uniref:NUDIX hydrolase n=1 Tax=uncultured Roseobacter sp. TaxID=114847 RepID=UPI002628EF05|nr:NUDIX hydrolase [uncultured Roseobacter sp.]
MIKQLPISLSGAGKRDVRTQFAALCYRVQKGKIRVLMITSRGSKRWIVPKGWPMDGLTPAGSAVQEAWEEAGVRGASDGRCLGIFSYSKDAEDLGALPCLAMVYAVEVETLADDYPEAGQRERAWMSRKKAARLVDEPELARILRDFDPRTSARSS